MTGPAARRAAGRSPPSVGRARRSRSRGRPRRRPNDGSSDAREQQRRRRSPSARPEPGDRARPAAPRADPGDDARRARAAPRSTSSTWTGPAAWRNVPHVVATGKTRLVTRNVTRLTTSERPERRRRDPTTAAPTRPMNEIGMPGQQQDVEQVVGEPVDAHLEQRAGPDGEVARQRRRIVPGEDVEAGDATGRWRSPGRAAGCRRRASRGSPTARRRASATTAGDRDERGRAAARSSPGMPPGHDQPRRAPSQIASLRVSAASPRSSAEPERAARSAQPRRRAASRSEPGHEQARRQGEAANGIVESGRAEWRSERQVDRGRQARSRWRASGRARAAGRARRRRRRRAARRAPGRATPTSDRRDLGGRERRCPSSAIGMRGRNVGSGSQTSNAGRGNDERRRLVAPQRVATRGRGPRAGCGRRRRSRRCPPASGRRSAAATHARRPRPRATTPSAESRPRDGSRSLARGVPAQRSSSRWLRQTG